MLSVIMRKNNLFILLHFLLELILRFYKHYFGPGFCTCIKHRCVALFRALFILSKREAATRIMNQKLKGATQPKPNKVSNAGNKIL